MYEFLYFRMHVLQRSTVSAIGFFGVCLQHISIWEDPRRSYCSSVVAHDMNTIGLIYYILRL